ncbi:enoyl-ACP reductase [Deltaproteobacteria bacterium TL4]
MIDYKGKKGVILGVGNKRSIAWAIAERMFQQGAELCLTYLEEPKGRFEANVRNLGEQVNASLIRPCDVSKDEEIQSLIEHLTEHWGEIDFLVHCLAFANTEELNNPFSQTSRAGFLKAQEISTYSLIPLTAGLAPLMKNKGGGSVLTFSYIGSVLAVPNYNVMGTAKASLESAVRYLAKEFGPDNIRVNAISAGAIRTLSALGVKDFSAMIKVAGEHSALKRTVNQSEVADAAAFLCSNAASAITGQVIYVDCGYSIVAS